MEATIVREPKGGPDVIFIGTPEMEKHLLLAGDHLSVRGFTARIVTLPPDVCRLDALDNTERERICTGGAPYICIPESERLLQADAATIANAALKEIQA